MGGIVATIPNNFIILLLNCFDEIVLWMQCSRVHVYSKERPTIFSGACSLISVHKIAL